jgi:hypothetical protein
LAVLYVLSTSTYTYLIVVCTYIAVSLFLWILIINSLPFTWVTAITDLKDVGTVASLLYVLMSAVSETLFSKGKEVNNSFHENIHKQRAIVFTDPSLHVCLRA